MEAILITKNKEGSYFNVHQGEYISGSLDRGEMLASIMELTHPSLGNFPYGTTHGDDSFKFQSKIIRLQDEIKTLKEELNQHTGRYTLPRQEGAPHV